MTTKYGRSPWIDRFPRSRVPAYPKYRGAAKADVVVIGGGLTGCATAYALAANGVKVVLLEEGQVGRGSTAMSPGWISDDPGVRFADLERQYGRRRARHAWQAWRRAALDFSALLRRLDIRCYLESRPAALVAMTVDAAAILKREQTSRREAGLETASLTARALKAELGIGALSGLRLKDGAILDPYRACLGLAAAAIARGALVFERSPVRRVTFDRKAANVLSAGGDIRTSRVVVATGGPTPLYKSLARHVWFRTTFAALTEPIPAKVRRELGSRGSMIRSAGLPAHSIRWVSEDRLLVAGADREALPDRQRHKAAVQRTGQLMYELSLFYPPISGLQPEYGWDAPYVLTSDGLPYLGAHRNFPHHVFAWGGTSPTFSYLASRIVSRDVAGEVDAADDVFGFNR